MKKWQWKHEWKTLRKTLDARENSIRELGVTVEEAIAVAAAREARHQEELAALAAHYEASLAKESEGYESRVARVRTEYSTALEEAKRTAVALATTVELENERAAVTLWKGRADASLLRIRKLEHELDVLAGAVAP